VGRSERGPHLRRTETARSGGGTFAGRLTGPPSDQAARPELRHRPEHRPPDHAHGGPVTRRRRAGGRTRARFLDARPARLGVPGRRGRGGPAVVLRTAGDRGVVRARPGRALRGRPRRRIADHLAAGSGSDRSGGQPALQRVGARAAAPAAAAAVPAPRTGDGASRGRRPAGCRAGIAHLRRPVGQGRLVRLGPARRVGVPERVLACPQRGLRTRRLAAPRPTRGRREPRAGLRGGRRGVRPATKDLAFGPAGDRRNVRTRGSGPLSRRHRPDATWRVAARRGLRRDRRGPGPCV
ncbi:MAG: SSU rRNA (adenine(1518)-N(6)/adenine(1519)-N(6))-dimethyltransferase, partial [uncultured Nocardioidaceae bacterium]